MPKKTVSPKSAPRARKTVAPSSRTLPEPPLVEACLRALEGKKAENVRVFDVRGKSSVTDFFIVATGTSEPHLRALRIVVEKVLDDAGASVAGREAQAGSGWIVVGAFEVIAHLFLPAKRTSCDIEGLWENGL